MNLWATARPASLSLTISRSLAKFMSIESVMPSNHLICHLTIWSSVTLFCLQSLPTSGSFLVSWLFVSGGQSVGTSASTSVLPKNIQGWFSSRLTGLISLLSKGLSRVFSSTTDQKHQFFGALPSLLSSSCIHTWLLEKTPLTIRTFVSKVMSLLFNTLHSFPTKEQLSSNFMAAVTICSDFRAQEVEICHCFHLFPFCLLWSDGTGCHDLSFLNIEF